MTITFDDLKRLDFRLTHVCVDDGIGSAKFEPAVDGDETQISSSAPMVYLWLSPKKDADGNKFDALYVGKARLGVSQRLRQHQGGFRQSASGKKNLVNLKELIGQGREVFVYARKANTQKILGASINLYSAEEEAIHELYRPLWNRAQFAGGNEKQCLWDAIEFNSVLGDLLKFYYGLNADDQDRLCRLLRWALCLEESEKAEMKVVRRYTDQPPGYDGIATFVLAPLDANGRAEKNGWVLRIPLRCDDQYPLTVTLPRSRTMGKRVQINQVAEGNGDNFRPLDLDDFLKRPDHYTTLTFRAGGAGC